MLCKRYELKKLLPRFEESATSKVQDDKTDTFKRICDFAEVEEFFQKLKESGKDFVGASVMSGDNKSIKGAALSVGDSTVYVDCAGFITPEYLSHKLTEISKAGVKLCFWDLKEVMHLIYNQMTDEEKANYQNPAYRN